LEWRRQIFYGTSHGAAAARAFSELRNGKCPDYGVLVLAGIRPGTGWPQDENLYFERVDGITAKVLAAAEDEEIDTIVVTPANRNEAVAAMNSAVRSEGTLRPEVESQEGRPATPRIKLKDRLRIAVLYDDHVEYVLPD
jgi:hypothetical protein